MFNKLLSNLPFNPSLIDQVGFYARRLQKDAAARRLGFGLIALTMVIQMFAVISPPQPTLANSSNDLIQGGVRSAADAAVACRQNTGGFADLLDQFNISCDNLAAAVSTTIDSRDFNGQLQTIGKLAYGKSGETPVAVKGKTVWLRPTKHWDNGSTKHEVLQGTSESGQKFYILKSCGGLTFVGTPPAPKPKCEWNAQLLATDPKCFQPCPIKGREAVAKTSSDCVASCPVKGKASLKASDPGCFEPCIVKGKENLPKDSAKCFEPCAYSSAIAAGDPDCKPCEASRSSADATACLALTKSVSNLTSGLADANGSTAQAGDVLRYTLTVKNQGQAKVDKFIIQENISDSLDYASLTATNGGGLSNDGVLGWAGEAINGGQTVAKTFEMTVKNPIVTTPVSASDPNHFDLTMTNVYGQVVSVKLPTPAVKSVESATRTLPNTGPGTSLLIGFTILTAAGFFYARSRLLAQELLTVKAEQSSAGGI